MKETLQALAMVFLLHPTLHAADKIRIGFPEFNSSTFTLPLAQIKGFFHEEGLQAELIRIRSAVALPALTSGEIDYHTVVSPAVNAALRAVFRSGSLLVSHRDLPRRSSHALRLSRFKNSGARR